MNLIFAYETECTEIGIIIAPSLEYSYLSETKVAAKIAAIKFISDLQIIVSKSVAGLLFLPHLLPFGDLVCEVCSCWVTQLLVMDW